MFKLLLALTLVPISHAELKVHVIDVGQAASALIELDHAAVLIDAGGEEDPRDGDNLRAALTTFFARRTDLNNTLAAVIVSHPHKDHTRNLMLVMRNFTVRLLVDDGDTGPASGMAELNDARAFAKQNNIPILAVNDSDIPDGGKLLDLDPGAEIRLLSGFRGCKNENNDSIAVRIQAGNASALFAGDAEMEDEGPCKSEPQLQHLLKRFGSGNLLGVKLYHATHHGSKNGVLDGLMKKVNPRASVIAAGTLKNRENGFHAYDFGHPRKQAIDSLTKFTKGSRTPKAVEFMTVDGGHHPGANPTAMLMKKAVYCTCWDGSLEIAFDASGEPKVTPLGANPPPPPPTAPSCNIVPADVFTPAISPPDGVRKLPAAYFLLSLSWSPQFCKTPAGQSARNRFQCQENSFGMVVHGLWPQAAGVTGGNGQPRNCELTTPIPQDILRKHLCTVPGVQLMQDEWAKHGTCAFDSPEKYLDRIEALMTSLRIPDLQALGAGLRAKDIIAAFVNANPGLTSDAVQLQVGSKQLQEVHVCYDMNFQFRRCDTNPTVADNAEVRIAPKAN